MQEMGRTIFTMFDRICDGLHDLLPLMQFKKRGKTPMEECYF